MWTAHQDVDALKQNLGSILLISPFKLKPCIFEMDMSRSAKKVGWWGKTKGHTKVKIVTEFPCLLGHPVSLQCI